MQPDRSNEGGHNGLPPHLQDRGSFVDPRESREEGYRSAEQRRVDLANSLNPANPLSPYYNANGRPPVSGTRNPRRAQAAAPATAATLASSPESEPAVDRDDSEEDDSEYDDDGEDGQAANGTDALGLGDVRWNVGQPRTQPLTYWIPSDANGGVRRRTIAFNVDFTSRASINKANKTRRLELGRARARFSLPKKRASMLDRDFSAENDQWLSDEYDRYAAANGGTRIPMSGLTTRYNAQFPNKTRTEASLSSRISRVPQLKAKRDQYDRF